jgi:hypothetical protein
VRTPADRTIGMGILLNNGIVSGPALVFLMVLITVTLTYAATQPADDATDGLLAGPASVFRASPTCSWATGYVASHPLQ